MYFVTVKFFVSSVIVDIHMVVMCLLVLLEKLPFSEIHVLTFSSVVFVLVTTRVGHLQWYLNIKVEDCKLQLSNVDIPVTI
jgi:hypothetical protein